MRSLVLGWAISAALLIGSSNAQPPQEIIAVDTIELKAGQARSFSFDQAVGKITTGAEGVAEVIPDTDRTFTIKGLAPGQVMMTAYAPDGKVIHRSNIAVSANSTVIKIFGDKTAVGGYSTYYCSIPGGCSRANPEIAPLPFSTSISETRSKGDGASESRVREYR
ncbi:pilus assembly protein N-terminal domain-containing protein [Bradyrhizobium sp. 26S5]|uniref:pilus assembly protein N-terminal domain-containing protein n=1 Tax=Bradyrhizobium sp. 26S5 TaxID=3139729 RepID=UPI0030D586AB